MTMSTNITRVKVLNFNANSGVSNTTIRKEKPKLIDNFSIISNFSMRVAIANPGMNAMATTNSRYNQ